MGCAASRFPAVAPREHSKKDEAEDVAAFEPAADEPAADEPSFTGLMQADDFTWGSASGYAAPTEGHATAVDSIYRHLQRLDHKKHVNEAPPAPAGAAEEARALILRWRSSTHDTASSTPTPRFSTAPPESDEQLGSSTLSMLRSPTKPRRRRAVTHDIVSLPTTLSSAPGGPMPSPAGRPRRRMISEGNVSIIVPTSRISSSLSGSHFIPSSCFVERFANVNNYSELQWGPARDVTSSFTSSVPMRRRALSFPDVVMPASGMGGRSISYPVEPRRY
jgi:hypothetical protein